MKAIKSIIETEFGFVNATFRNGKRIPEDLTWWADKAQLFTERQAEVLMEIVKGNEVEIKRAIYVQC